MMQKLQAARTQALSQSLVVCARVLVIESYLNLFFFNLFSFFMFFWFVLFFLVCFFFWGF